MRVTWKKIKHVDTTRIEQLVPVKTDVPQTVIMKDKAS